MKPERFRDLETTVFKEYQELIDPEASGLKVINSFAQKRELEAVLEEINNPQKVKWLDTHEIYKNKRGLTIIQNHFTFALKLDRGDQSFLKRLPETVKLKERTQAFIKELVPLFPSLASWQADELSFHLYDNQKVGLSRHRDNLRFRGLIAIVSLSGQCDLVITHREERIVRVIKAGDLCLLRAPGLIKSNQEIRPEHSVQNLKSKTRLSMMLRSNNRPAEAIEGFKFNNWQTEIS